MSKQCTCGRSEAYPFCDNTHTQPASPVIKTINPHTFTYFKNEEIDKDKFGISQNKIVQIPRFISKSFSKQIMDIFEADSLWQDVGFHKAKNLFHIDFFSNKELESTWEELVSTIKRSVELVFGEPVSKMGIYIQKWPEGSYGIEHNDSYNFDGSIGNITSKIATTLFLYSPFTGGKLEFPEHDISIDPKAGSLYVFPGGPENQHRITEVESGLRFTVIAFWDFDSSVYTKEQLDGMQKSKERWNNYMKTGEGL